MGPLRRPALRASVRRHRRVPQPGRASNQQGAPPSWLVSDSQGRRWSTRREVPRSIETRNKDHACMAHRWNKTKKKTVLRIRLGRDQGRSRCLVALSKRWKLALISRSVSSHRRAGNKTQNSSDALQTIVFPGTRQRDKRSHRRAGNKNPERCPPND